MRLRTEISMPAGEPSSSYLVDGELFYSASSAGAPQRWFRLTQWQVGGHWSAVVMAGGGFWIDYPQERPEDAVEGLLPFPPGTEIRIVVEE